MNAIFALLVGGIFFMRDDTPRGMADRYINLVILLHPLGWFSYLWRSAYSEFF